MAQQILGSQEAVVLTRLCELVVPGSVRIGPVGYVERVLAGMSEADEDAVHSAIGVVASCLDSDDSLALVADTEAFLLLRRLAIEAFYGDFVEPGHTGPTGHDVIDFNAPQARRVRKDWSFLDPRPAARASTVDDAEVVVVGSGAGGGLIAAELGRRGHDVLVLEAGGLHHASSYSRFELAARDQLWWPTRFTQPRGEHDEPVALLAGRCVGGTTVINTKVAMRASELDVARFHEQTGLLGATGNPFAPADLLPWYELVEKALGVRERADWTPSVHRVNAGFRALGASLEPVLSYTDYNCTRCGSCTTGCPTNAGRSTLNTFLAPALGRGEIRLATHRMVEQVHLDTSPALPTVAGVSFRNPDGSTGRVAARTVVLAAGSLNTPQILLRSGDYVGLDTASTRLVGTTLGLHPARLVYGLFDEPQDCHLAYPISAHCLAHQQDFVVEATTIQEPVSFADGMVDEHGRPLWGARLAEVARTYRYWAGLLVMANDENTGTIELDAAGQPVFTKGFSPTERQRLDAALSFGVNALRAAGARDVVCSGLSTSHVQGSARMGSDPARAVTNPAGRTFGVSGLYLGDGSLIPASLSVNPSLTIMALAARVADGIAEELAS